MPDRSIESAAPSPHPADRPGMRLVHGGPFEMGSENFYADERPIRSAVVGDFWIDETPVTNAQFGRFVRETGHVTIAEIAPDPGDYAGMDPMLAVPGSAVFAPPSCAVDLTNGASWWQWAPGANWSRPTGPASNLTGLARHPAVHIGFDDARAYAHWAGKQLPSEAEWEYAARGGLVGADYAWGDALHPDGRRLAKTWDGRFPWDNRAPPGLERTSPVKSYPANGFGLYDMIGNVWEWTTELYDRPDAADEEAPACCGTDGATPDRAAVRRVLKGGSHLCSPDYCQRYRPAARWPQPVDTTTSHVGFRCIVRL